MLIVDEINMHDKKVFDNYFRIYYQSLCYFAYNYLKESEGAEDVVQNVFIKLLDGEERFENEEHLKRYLYKAVRNSCIDQIRKAGIHSAILDTIQKNDTQDENDFFSKVVRAEVYREIMDAVKELPTECGRIFKLAYVDGFNNDEIAAQLSISVNTVKAQKNKAKIQLREKLKGVYPVVFFIFGV